MTDLQKEYNKQRRRIQSFISRKKKEGFIWLDNPLPDKPKKITPASIRRLDKIRPEQLYKKANYIDPFTGEILAGTKGMAIRKNLRSQRATPTATDVILDNFYGKIEAIKEQVENFYGKLEDVKEKIDNYNPIVIGSYMREMKEHDVARLRAIFYVAYNYDKDQLAFALLQAASKVDDLLDIIMYDSDSLGKVRDALAEFARIINSGSSLTMRDKRLLSDMHEQYYE